MSQVCTGFSCQLPSLKLFRDSPVVSVHSGDARIVPTVKPSGKQNITYTDSPYMEDITMECGRQHGMHVLMLTSVKRETLNLS